MKMKVGLRTPSLKRSIKARTTGKWKRQVKSAVNPWYGKKGMGFIKNPEKSVKNAIYHRTTFGVGDLVKTSTGSHKKKTQNQSAGSTDSSSKNIAIAIGVGILIIAAVIAYWKAALAIAAVIMLIAFFIKKK